MRVKKDVEQTIGIWEKEYKKGFTAYIVMSLLHGKPMYGYEIKQQMEDFTGGIVTFKESAIYQILKHMKKKGFLEAYWDKSPRGPRRRYYRVTESGQDLLAAFTQCCLLPLNTMLQASIEQMKETMQTNEEIE